MFDNVFGIHEQALLLHGQRLSVLANNIANVDTPNYKARDIDFAEVLGNADGGATLPMSLTNSAHMALTDGGGAGGVRRKQRPLPGQPELHQRRYRRSEIRHRRPIVLGD